MANKNQNPVEETLKADEALSKTALFFEEHAKVIIGCFVAVVVIAAGIVLFKNQYVASKNEEASTKLAQCVYYFEQDSFALALNGDGMNEGFADIADGYRFTDARNLACFYSAVCCYNLGQYEDAIDYIKRFSTKSVNYKPAAITLEGDCHVALGDIDAAIKCFEKAGAIDNVLTAPRALSKAGICYEEQKNYAKAIKCYETIKDKYFDSPLAQEMEKRIERCNILNK